jgi:predicted cupin superfamily sugar epimerase
MSSAKYWIEKLDLTKHPEGGYFKEVYRSAENMPKKNLPARYQSNRNFATSIYFLLEGKEFSSFHRIQSDETWHFYVGSTLELHVLNADGSLTSVLLGRNPEQDENLQVTIPHNHWFGARVVDATGFALLGCTVAPGFHFDDFELADRSKLLEQFPGHSQLITELTFI